MFWLHFNLPSYRKKKNANFMLNTKILSLHTRRLAYFLRSINHAIGYNHIQP